MRIGYARISTHDQNPEAQHDALIAAGCEHVFVDNASGKLDYRPLVTACQVVMPLPLSDSACSP